MGTAYIDATITAEFGGVLLFETDCAVEIEYTIDAGELVDWYARDFRFDAFSSRQIGGDWVRVKTAEAWCPDILRPALNEFLDKDALEDRLVDHLYAEGELYSAHDDIRSDHHARAA